jgi:hypothetical protein
MLVVICFLLSGARMVHAAPEEGAAPYAGMDTREIRTLSEDDVSQLLAGAGWGLALAAERMQSRSERRPERSIR